MRSLRHCAQPARPSGIPTTPQIDELSRDQRERTAAPQAALMRRMAGRVKRFATILMGILRELSDESAYRRHLAAHGRAHSPEEWRRFSDHRLHAKYIRPKCC